MRIDILVGLFGHIETDDDRGQIDIAPELAYGVEGRGGAKIPPK
jgi:hypothetical protein